MPQSLNYEIILEVCTSKCEFLKISINVNITEA